MKIKNLSILILLSINTFLYNQTFVSQSIKLNENKELFYTLSSNTSQEIDQTGWDIALMENIKEVGGKINEQKGVRLWIVYKDLSQFSSITINDTLLPRVNSDKYMYMGAFDSLSIEVPDVQSYYRLGIGKFFLSDYSAIGDRCFIVKSSSGEYYKLALISYTANTAANKRTYKLRLAKIDNSNEKEVEILKANTNTKDYMYINLSTLLYNNSFEPSTNNSWDFKLAKYNTINNGSVVENKCGIFLNNSAITAAYSNISGLPPAYKIPVNNTQVYNVVSDPQTTNYNNSFSNAVVSYTINQMNNSIWDNNGALIQNNNFFIKSNSGAIYHLYFTSFDKNKCEATFNTKKIVSSISNNQYNDAFNIEKENNILKISNLNSDIFSIEVYDISGKKISSDSDKRLFELDLREFENNILFIKMFNDNINKYIKFIF